MHPKLIVANAVLAAAIVAAPLAASAQPDPNGDGDRYQWCREHPRQCARERERIEERREREERRENRGYNNGYGYGYGDGRLRGRVTNFSPYNLDLSNGPHVKLHNGTVINPTGISLQPGEIVAVFGHPNSDGTFEADRIDVIGNGRYYGGYNNGR